MAKRQQLKQGCVYASGDAALALRMQQQTTQAYGQCQIITEKQLEIRGAEPPST